MMDYNKLYFPYRTRTHNLSNAISWLKENTKAEDYIINQVVADIMLMVANGEKFALPCPCGCEINKPNAHIDHYMRSRVLALKDKVTQATVKIIEENEKQRLQGQMKLLSKNDKELYKLRYGTWWERTKNKSEVVSLYRKIRKK